MEQTNHVLEKWKQVVSKWFSRDNLVILVLSGVLLFLIALPVKDGTANQKQETEDMLTGRLSGSTESLTSQGVTTGTGKNGEEYQEAYTAYLEKKLEGILSSMDGVGEVEVMLTMESSEELVVEKDEPVSRSNTNETDSAGGNRVITSLETSETTIYRTDGNASDPFVVKTLVPRVEGVLVVAEGAGRGSIDKNITEIVQALFGVEAHKVKVVARQTEG